jgi:hypothetical protein
MSDARLAELEGIVDELAWPATVGGLIGAEVQPAIIIPAKTTNRLVFLTIRSSLKGEVEVEIGLRN